MADIVIHIGLRKTGTTSIQKFLHANRGLLLEKGILYPSSGLPVKESRYAHHDLAADLTGIRPPTVPGSWEKLSDEISEFNGKLIFISSEIFSVAITEKIEELRKRLSGHKVTILLYLRDPAKFIVSLYKAQIKGHNEFRSFRNFIRRKPEWIDFDPLVESWQRVFGPENLVLKNYDELAGGDLLLSNLIDSIGLSDSSAEFRFLEKANVTPDDKVVAAIRILNYLKKKIPMPASAKEKIKIMVADLNKGNERGQMLLARYQPFLPKMAVSRKDMIWLEKHLHMLGSEYKTAFRNDFRFLQD